MYNMSNGTADQRVPHPTCRPKQTLAGAVGGAVLGLTLAWVVPVAGIAIMNGLDGDTIMWACEAGKAWQLGMVVIGTAFGGMAGAMGLMPGFGCDWIFSVLWIFLAAGIGMHIGEMTRLQWEESLPGAAAYCWNPWPGGVGITTGAAFGFFAWVLLWNVNRFASQMPKAGAKREHSGYS